MELFLALVFLVFMPLSGFVLGRFIEWRKAVALRAEIASLKEKLQTEKASSRVALSMAGDYCRILLARISKLNGSPS